MKKFGIICLLLPALAFATDISQIPLSGSSVKPNVIIGYDDSGSMEWDYVPDSMGSSTLIDDYHYNPLAYNPTMEYLPWITDIAFNRSITRAANGPVTATTIVNYVAGDTLSSGLDYTVTYNCNNYSTSINFDTGNYFTSKATCTSVTGKSYNMSDDYIVARGQTWNGQANYGYYYDILPAASCTQCPAAKVCPASAVCKDLPSPMTAASHVRKRVFFTDSNSQAAINYANWKKYYRTRQLLMASAMSDVLPELGGVNMGIIQFNAAANASMASQGKMYNLDYYKDIADLLNYIYKIDPNGGTPTHAALAKIGGIFANKNLQLKLNTNDGIATTGTGIIQYACQKNATLITTDGYANGTSPKTIAYDASIWGATSPYTKIYANSLADHALAYFTINPRTDLITKQVATDVTRCDPALKDYLADCNDNLHMNTYALTLGVPGDQYKPNANGQAAFPANWNSPITGTTPGGGVEQIDDLWHATINGRGQMFGSNDRNSLVNSFKSAFTNIVLRATTQSSIAVANVNLTSDNNKVYTASFDAATWTGDVKAYNVDLSTGQVITPPVWSASQLLDTNVNRKFYSKGGSITQIPGIDPALSDYLLGKPDDNLRYRSHIMGDVVNASPVVFKGMVYQAANDGMLHAFDSTTGVENWAYIPSQNIPYLSLLSDPHYTHRYYVDSTPTVGIFDTSGSVMLTGGLGAGQFGYYAINVTDPANPVPMWEFPGTQNIGNNGGMTSISQPRLIPTASTTYPYLVVVSSGYNNGTAAKNSNGDGYGYVWFLNPQDGKIVATLKTSDKTTDGIGLASFSAFVPNNIVDSKVAYLYAGDNLGNVWKIDARSTDITKWTISKFAFINQPITTKPTLASLSGGNPLILFGTGRFLGMTDKSNLGTGGFFAIQDFQLASPTLITTSSLVKITAVGDPLQNRTLPATSCVSWQTKGNYGWYIVFPQAGERLVNNPEIGLGYVTFTSNALLENSCLSASYAWIVNLNLSAGALCSTPGSGGDDTTIPGLNKGLYLSELFGSNATLLGLTNGKILRYVQLGDGSFNVQDLGSFGLLHSAIRSLRELKQPTRPN